MNTANLLALVMQKQNLPSYRQVGKMLDVSGGNVANWAKERSIPTDEHIIELCKLAKEDAAHWIVLLRFNQASSRTRTVWAEIYSTVNQSKRASLPY